MTDTQSLSKWIQVIIDEHNKILLDHLDTMSPAEIELEYKRIINVLAYNKEDKDTGEKEFNDKWQSTGDE